MDEALAAHPRLVILGDPGSGKTTLLRYLALLYARDLAEGTRLVQKRLELGEGGDCPLPNRAAGAHVAALSNRAHRQQREIAQSGVCQYHCE